MSQKSSRIIPLARLLRRHGNPKSGIVSLKAELLSPGGGAFAVPLSRVFISPATSPDNFKEWPLVDECSPLGAKWGQASGVILRFSERNEPPAGSWVGLPREELPPLEPGDFYVCDVIGHEVVDETGRVFGQLAGFSDIAPTLGGSVNLSVKTPTGSFFEFPAAWATLSENDGKQICVPDLAMWAELDPRAQPDDGDDER